MPLYIHDRPVRGSNAFFGRQMLVRTLLGGIDAGRKFALIGGPKMGRSSVLQLVADQLAERQRRQPAKTRIVPVSFDFAALHGPRADAFVPLLWGEIEAAVTNPHALAKGHKVRVAARRSSARDNPWETFRALAHDLWQQTTGTASWLRYVLLLDNVDALIVRRQYSALEELGRLLTQAASYAPCAAVISGGRYLREYLFSEDVALHRLRTVFLGSLHDSDALAMIRLGFPDIEQGDAESLAAHSGRHPYLLARLLGELEQQGSAGEIDRAIQGVTDDVADLFERIWAEFDLNRQVACRGVYAAPEHALMQLLIERQQPLTLATAENELGIKPLKEYGEFLQYQGLVQATLNHDRRHLVSGCRLWNSWYLNRSNR